MNQTPRTKDIAVQPFYLQGLAAQAPVWLPSLRRGEVQEAAMNHRAKVCPPSRTSTGPAKRAAGSARAALRTDGGARSPLQPRELTRTVRTRRARAAPAALSARGTAPPHPTRLPGPFPPPKSLLSRLPMGVWGWWLPNLLHGCCTPVPSPYQHRSAGAWATSSPG